MALTSRAESFYGRWLLAGRGLAPEDVVKMLEEFEMGFNGDAEDSDHAYGCACVDCGSNDGSPSTRDAVVPQDEGRQPEEAMTGTVAVCLCRNSTAIAAHCPMHNPRRPLVLNNDAPVPSPGEIVRNGKEAEKAFDSWCLGLGYRSEDFKDGFIAGYDNFAAALAVARKRLESKCRGGEVVQGEPDCLCSFHADCAEDTIAALERQLKQTEEERDRQMKRADDLSERLNDAESPIQDTIASLTAERDRERVSHFEAETSLIAERDAALARLKEVTERYEWFDYHDADYNCPDGEDRCARDYCRACGEWRRAGHKANCIFAALAPASDREEK